MRLIFQKILNSAKLGPVKWPIDWKKEFGTPIQKKVEPEVEDDLRIISLTPFFSKIFERFVVAWIMEYFGQYLDPKQFGGMKDNSIAHYMIELINFVLYNQDFNAPIAVLMCAVDFSKAFNRINHNIVITKLADIGAPGWLLNIVMGFLLHRVMVVRYRGATSNSMQMPGGSPQGTLLGLILFLIMINDCGRNDAIMFLH